MSEQLTWTQKLGDAMLGQQQDVADFIQRLRARASAAGNLQSTPQQTVTTQGSGDSVQYVITPTNPEVIYVPSYNPSSAYGAWPYPAYPPYQYPYGGVLATGLLWGLGIAAAGAIYGGWRWGGYGNSYANVNVNRAVNIDRNFDRNRIDGDRWAHAEHHRKGVAYRDDATRQRFGQQARPGTADRDQFRGRLESGGRPGGPGGPGGLAVQEVRAQAGRVVQEAQAVRVVQEGQAKGSLTERREHGLEAVRAAFSDRRPAPMPGHRR